MKEIIKQRNFKNELLSLLFVAIASILMLIQNIAVSQNETLSLTLYIISFFFSVFCLAVRAVNKALDKNISADLIVCVCAFVSFLLGFYQTGIISALVFEYIYIIFILISSFIFKHRSKNYVRILSDAKQRVKLYNVEINDRILVNEGEILPFKCRDTVSGNLMQAGESVPKNTVVQVYSLPNIYKEYEPDFVNADKSKKLSLLVAAGLLLVSAIICIVLNVLGGAVDVAVYNILSVLACLPFELIFLKFDTKNTNIIYLSVSGIVTLPLVALSIFGILALWIAVTVRAVITFSFKIIMNFMKL